MKKENNTKGKTKGEKIIFGFQIFGLLLLAPVMFLFFTADRMILVFLPHQRQESVQETFKNLQNFVPILYRVGSVGIVLLILKIWKTFF